MIWIPARRRTRVKVYYSADSLQTAIAEMIHHFAAFALDGNDSPGREDTRVLVGSIFTGMDNTLRLSGRMLLAPHARKVIFNTNGTARR